VARRSKPKRRRIRLDALLAVLLGLNIIVGIRFSPLFALRHVRVVGGQPTDGKLLENVFETVMDVPVLSIKRQSLETSFQNLPEVDSASFEANIFGSGKLTLHYRVPVARLGSTAMAVDAGGTIWRTRQNISRLPDVRLPASCLTAGLSLAKEAPVRAVAELAMKLQNISLEHLGDIVLDDSGTVCLNRGDHGRIVFGGTEAMDEKLTRLAGLLNERPELFTGPFEVNLTAPTHPVFSRLEPSNNATVHPPSP
jgi:hypothetical protein